MALERHRCQLGPSAGWGRQELLWRSRAGELGGADLRGNAWVVCTVLARLLEGDRKVLASARPAR